MIWTFICLLKFNENILDVKVLELYLEFNCSQRAERTFILISMRMILCKSPKCVCECVCVSLCVCVCVRVYVWVYECVCEEIYHRTLCVVLWKFRSLIIALYHIRKLVIIFEFKSESCELEEALRVVIPSPNTRKSKICLKVPRLLSFFCLFQWRNDDDHTLWGVQTAFFITWIQMHDFLKYSHSTSEIKLPWTSHAMTRLICEMIF